jgi:lipid-A-disaccharide synthase-like uncharacterized protein
MRHETIWLGIGLGGQAMFFMRFVVQWIVSEIKKRSIIPKAFWYFSILGSLILLAYAIHRRDPVFIIGQSAGSLIYIRNIQLIPRERNNRAIINNHGQ